MNISLFTKEELESKKLTEITDHYNQVAKLIGLKAVKRFRDKPTSVSRTLNAQETYRDDITIVLPPEKEPSQNWGKITCSKTALQGKKKVKANRLSKEKSSRTKVNKLGITEDSVLEVLKGTEYYPKEGCIEHSLYIAIANTEGKVSEVINYVICNHKRPRSDQKVDEAYALHNIKWFVKKGHLKVVG